MYVCPECGESYPAAGLCSQDRSALHAVAGDTLLGSVAGSYRLASRIGAGGMGEVYKGVQPSIGSRVAIKVLAHEWAHKQELVERFFSEARAVNLIRHEHIVNVLDLAWLPDGRPYIVMEYLDGAPLSVLIRGRGPLPLGAVVQLVGEVLDAVAAAHAKGVIHRDLKPDNVYVTPGGHAKVLDFGVAKLKPEISSLQGNTRTGAILGSPYYMSPEQALGRNVDARSDLYSLGVILFEAFTGRLPFTANTLFELLRQHIESVPPSPRSLRPDLPPALEHAVLRALEKDPERRYGSAREFGNVLGQLRLLLPSSSFQSLHRQRSTMPVSTVGNARNPAQPANPAAGCAGPAVAPAHPAPPGHSGGYPAPGDFAAPTAPSPGQATPALAAVPGTTAPGYAQPLPSSKRGNNLWLILAAAAAAVLVLGGVATAAVLFLVGTVMLTDPEESSSTPSVEDRRSAPAPADSDETAPRSQDPAATRVKEAPQADHDDGSVNVHNYRPEGFDPTRVVVWEHYLIAEKRAAQRFPDAKLVRIDVYGVNSDGLVNLEVSGDFSSSVLFRWRSPAKSQPPPELPKGAKYKSGCLYYYSVSSRGISRYTVENLGCEEPIVPRPRCTLRQVWREAVKHGAPKENYIGNISYYSAFGAPARWYVRIGEFSRFLPDKC